MLNIPRLFYFDRRAAGAANDAGVIDHATRLLRHVAHDLRLGAREHEIVAKLAYRGRNFCVTLSTPVVTPEVADAPGPQSGAVRFRMRRGRSGMSSRGANVMALEQPGSRDGCDSLVPGLRLAAGLDNDRR